MRKYYIGITVLILFAVILGGILFSLVGSPLTLREKQLDATRLSDFSSIQSSIQSFYSDKKRLPVTLEELKAWNSPINIKDAETNKNYDYKTESSQSGYTLCTVFSTDNRSEQDQSNGNYMGTYLQQPMKHKKGYDCVTLKLPSSLTTPTPISLITPIPVSLQSISPQPQAAFLFKAPQASSILCFGSLYNIVWESESEVQGVKFFLVPPSKAPNVSSFSISQLLPPGVKTDPLNPNFRWQGSYTWKAGDVTTGENVTDGYGYRLGAAASIPNNGTTYYYSDLFSISSCGNPTPASASTSGQ